MTRYKIETFWKLDKPMFSLEEAISQAKSTHQAKNKNIIKINVVVKDKGVQKIIKTFERRANLKTKKL